MGGPRSLSGRLGRKQKSLAPPSSTGTKRDDQGIVVRFLAEAIIVCVCVCIHADTLRIKNGNGHRLGVFPGVIYKYEQKKCNALGDFCVC